MNCLHVLDLLFLFIVILLHSIVLFSYIAASMLINLLLLFMLTAALKH